MIPAELVVDVGQVFVIGVDEVEPFRVRHLAVLPVNLAAWPRGGMEGEVKRFPTERGHLQSYWGSSLEELCLVRITPQNDFQELGVRLSLPDEHSTDPIKA